MCLAHELARRAAHITGDSGIVRVLAGAASVTELAEQTAPADATLAATCVRIRKRRRLAVTQLRKEAP